MHSFVRILFFGSLVLLASALWLRDALPKPHDVRQEMFAEPQQVPRHIAPFEIKQKEVTYEVRPRFSYDLYGVVVSRHDSEAWWDYIHKEWNDKLNVVDLCVAWGNNVSSGAYREASYSHDQWTCWYKPNSAEAADAFDTSEISNNHMLTDNPAIAKALRSARVGDQVHFRGHLADYTTFKGNTQLGTRVSSSVRTDSGNGACEVVYVDDFEILKPGGGPWRTLTNVALGLLVLSILWWFALPARLNR